MTDMRQNPCLNFRATGIEKPWEGGLLKQEYLQMAYATDIAATPAKGLVAGIVSVFTKIGNGLIRLAEANQRVQRCQRLMDLSDAQLAKRGMKREDIVRHVFADCMHI